MSSAPLPDPASLLPLTPAAMQILLTLAGGERHGYSIMRAVEASTDGSLKLGPTTLYRSIKQLLAARVIEMAAERPDPDLDDERRRYYRLTAFGLSVLQAETRRLAALVTQAHAQGVVAEGDLPGLSFGGAL